LSEKHFDKVAASWDLSKISEENINNVKP